MNLSPELSNALDVFSRAWRGKLERQFSDGGWLCDLVASTRGLDKAIRLYGFRDPGRNAWVVELVGLGLVKRQPDGKHGPVCAMTPLGWSTWFRRLNPDQVRARAPEPKVHGFLQVCLTCGHLAQAQAREGLPRRCPKCKGQRHPDTPRPKRVKPDRGPRP